MEDVRWWVVVLHCYDYLVVDIVYDQIVVQLRQFGRRQCLRPNCRRSRLYGRRQCLRPYSRRSSTICRRHCLRQIVEWPPTPRSRSLVVPPRAALAHSVDLRSPSPSPSRIPRNPLQERPGFSLVRERPGPLLYRGDPSSDRRTPLSEGTDVLLDGLLSAGIWQEWPRIAIPSWPVSHIPEQEYNTSDCVNSCSGIWLTGHEGMAILGHSCQMPADRMSSRTTSVPSLRGVLLSEDEELLCTGVL